MKLVVTGATAEKRAFVREAIRWVVENQLALRDDIRVNVRFTDTKGEWHGEAYHVAQSSYRSKSFTIVLSDKLDTTEDVQLFTETIMHEMVHIWQMANKVARFTLSPKGDIYRVFWKGIEMTDVSYWRQPWERQAFRLEKTLAKKFLASRSA